MDQSIGALIDSITHGDHEPTVAPPMESISSNFDLSKSLFTQTTNDDISESQLLGLCSGAFVTQVPDTQKVSQFLKNEWLLIFKFFLKESLPETIDESAVDVRLAFDSSSDDNCDREDEGFAIPKSVKRKTKRMQALKVDDDDDEEQAPAAASDDERPDDDDDESVEDEEAEQPERFVDYDSEENEVEVVMNKKDRVKKAGEFFEQEADLSGSEYGSADEDERGMDKYDIELGDDDEFDQSKIQSELERIHM